ncbi:MFS transporter [Actinopolymorpha alba]|uniref:MFS transporter n=1 Tax=Actinopolymorpha alba TaxID=533267 RepID=UPI000377AD4B|nr:MFS transporter [Actinopolymorpha alba]
MPLLLLAYLAFVSIALPDSILGMAWPLMRQSLGGPMSALGFMVPFGIAGYLTSSSLTGFLLARISVGWLLAGSTAASAVSLVACGLAPALWVVAAAMLVGGFGSGAVDSGLNAYAASHFGARHINWMHASYGLGATAGPLLITAGLASGLSWRWGYAVLAVVQTFLCAAFALTARSWGPAGSPGGGRRPRQPASAPSASEAAEDRRPSGRAAIWRGVAAVALQTGVESATSLWAFVFLTEGRGLATEPAGLTVSAYWAAMFVGRLVLGPLAERVGVRPVLTGGVLGVIAATLLMALPAPPWVAAVGITAAGFATAPIFPLMTLTTSERVGARRAQQAIGFQVAASTVGSAGVSAGVGVVVGHLGAAWIGPCLLALAVAMGVAYAGIRR